MPTTIKHFNYIPSKFSDIFWSIYEVILFFLCALLMITAFCKIKAIKNPLNNLSYCKTSVLILNLVKLSMLTFIAFNAFWLWAVFNLTENCYPD